MRAFKVYVRDIDGQMNITVCETDRDLVNLINNFNVQDYEIVKVEAIDNYSQDYTEFCTKNNKLELGEKT